MLTVHFEAVGLHHKSTEIVCAKCPCIYRVNINLLLFNDWMALNNMLVHYKAMWSILAKDKREKDR